MPKNKNALLRYRILDKCFQEHNMDYTIDKLLLIVQSEIGDSVDSDISERTIKQDIKFMRSKVGFDADIKTYPGEGRKHYYAYEKKGYSIFTSNLSSEDKEQLRAALGVISRFRGIANVGWLDEIIKGMEVRFGLKTSKTDLVSFDNNSMMKGIGFLSDIIDATINQQPLKVRYHSFSYPEETYTFHPYHVRQYNKRWFVFGLKCTAKEKIVQTLALDRIVKIRKLSTKFIKNTTVDYSTYFDDIIGVSHTLGEKQTIKLKFEPNRFRYAETKPMHPSQKIIDRDNCIITLEVKPNRELEAKIFEFGHQVEVLEPQALRERFREYFRKGCEMYGEGEKE